MNLLIFHTSSLTEKTSDPFQSFASLVTGFIKNAFVFFLSDWSWFDNWNVYLLGFAFSDSTATFLDKLNGVSSRGTVGTFNSDLSFNGLGGRAATALPLHFTVFVDSGTDTFTGAHVDFKVSFDRLKHVEKGKKGGKEKKEKKEGKKGVQRSVNIARFGPCF